MKQWMIALAGILCCSSTFGATLEECRALQHHGRQENARVCFTALSRDEGNAFLRAEGDWGLHRYQEANDEFRQAIKERANAVSERVEWGNFLLERFERSQAISLFEEALKINPDFAPAYLGLSHAAAGGFEKKAVDFAHQALQHDPRSAAAHEWLAYLALEDSDYKLAADESNQALAIHGEALDALAVLASIDVLAGAGIDKPASPSFARIQNINPVYGEAWSTAAHFLVINGRYADGVAFYRKAIALNAELYEARSQLGINLMRLGLNGEARKHLEQCYEAHWRNAETVNSLRLLDKENDYEAFKSPHVTLTLAKSESALLQPYLSTELERVIATYNQKYRMTLPGPVSLQVYPNHEDFVVRCLGLPGQGGILGVTFGLAFVMDSPSAREPGEFNWAGTLWHEMSHVYVLTATHHLVPRWFTEGVAVHEENAASPDRGDRLTPSVIDALAKHKFLSVLELDRGFVRPSYPDGVLVAYYQAGQICDYIASKWGDDAIRGMIHSYSVHSSTADAITNNLHITPAQFDAQFAQWHQAQNGKTMERFADWKKHLQAAWQLQKSGKNDDMIKEGLAIRNDYPEFIGGGSVYELLSTAYVAKGDKTAAIAQLEQYRDHGGRGVETLHQLAKLEQETGHDAEALRTLTSLNYIYPEDAALHEQMGSLQLHANRPDASIEEFKAVLALHPSDPAQSHFNLAQALMAAKRPADAKDEVIWSLEAAPDFKPAQHLLLELSH